MASWNLNWLTPQNLVLKLCCSDWPQRGSENVGPYASQKQWIGLPMTATNWKNFNKYFPSRSPAAQWKRNIHSLHSCNCWSYKDCLIVLKAGFGQWSIHMKTLSRFSGCPLPGIVTRFSSGLLITKMNCGRLTITEQALNISNVWCSS